MKDEALLTEADVRLFAQQALLGCVWPTLRAVNLQVVKNVILIYFFYHGELDALHRSLYERALDSFHHLIKSYSTTYPRKIIHEAYRHDYPQGTIDLGSCIYYRYEPFPPRKPLPDWVPANFDQEYSNTDWLNAVRAKLFRVLETLNNEQDSLPRGLHLIVQNGLLWEILPDYREVAVELKGEDINLYFYIDGVIPPEHKERAKNAFAIIKRDCTEWFPTRRKSVKLIIERLDAPTLLPKRGDIVYYRYEPGSSNSGFS